MIHRWFHILAIVVRIPLSAAVAVPPNKVRTARLQRHVLLVDSGYAAPGVLAAHAAQLTDGSKIQARIRAQRVDIQFLPYDWQLNAAGAQ